MVGGDAEKPIGIDRDDMRVCDVFVNRLAVRRLVVRILHDASHRTRTYPIRDRRAYACVSQGVVVQSTEDRILPSDLNYVRVEVDEGRRSDIAVLQDLAHGKTIATPKHEHVLVIRNERHDRMNQGFVVAGLVIRRELQVAVDVESRVVDLLVFRYDEALVWRRLGEDDRLVIQPILELVAPGAVVMKAKCQEAGDGEHDERDGLLPLDLLERDEVDECRECHDHVAGNHDEADLRQGEVGE